MVLRPEIVPDSDLRRVERLSLNRVPSTFDWRIWGELCDTIALLKDTHGIHRKSWEYATCILGLRKLCQIQPHFKAFATGAGYERPLFHYANIIAEMHATDLYDLSHPEGQPSMLTNPASYAPFPYRSDHLFVQSMNATNLTFEDKTFEFGFTLSSIEHFGDREAQRRAFSEMVRVTKRGGILCVITELILNDKTHPEYFRPEELEYVFLSNPHVRLVGGDMDMRVQQSLFEFPCDLRDPDNADKSPHLVVTDGEVIWTSFSMFFEKTH